MQDSSFLLPLSDSDSGDCSLASPGRSPHSGDEPRLAPCGRGRGGTRLPQSPGDRGSRARLIEECASCRGDVLERRLSRGVFLAYSPALGVQTVLRVDSPKNIAHQAAVLRYLTLRSWPGAPRYCGVWQFGGMACLRIEYIAGATALELLLTRSLTLDFVIDFQRRLARLLRSLHALGVVHLDVKPDNVVVRPDGTLCLIDWEHACFLAAPPAARLEPCGTFAYLAPELLSRAATAPHAGLDVWSFGATFMVLLTGQVARPARDPLPVSRCQHLPPDFAAVVRAALIPDPRQRPSFDQLCHRHFSLRAAGWSDVLRAYVRHSAHDAHLAQPTAVRMRNKRSRDAVADADAPTDERPKTRADRSPMLALDDQPNPVACRSVTVPASLRASPPAIRQSPPDSARRAMAIKSLDSASDFFQ